MFDIGHARAAVHGQDLDAFARGPVAHGHQQPPVPRVTREVGAEFGDHEREAPGGLLVELQAGGQQHAAPTRVADLAGFGDVEDLMHGHAHRVIVTQVPSPTTERIANSCTSRLLPDRPSPMPPPDVQPSVSASPRSAMPWP